MRGFLRLMQSCNGSELMQPDEVLSLITLRRNGILMSNFFSSSSLRTMCIVANDRLSLLWLRTSMPRNCTLLLLLNMLARHMPY